MPISWAARSSSSWRRCSTSGQAKLVEALTPTPNFAGPVKRSITIAGHQTSISLEPDFWAALEQAARTRSLPLSALVAEIDAVRVGQANAPNLASAIRTWLLREVANYSQ